MHRGQKILGVIPARGGSKGLPGKNVKQLMGKPLIAWTIEQAKQSECIDTLIVNTDDKEISRTALAYGAEIPFMRPAELARDASPVAESILYTIRFFEDREERFDLLVLLECTSPLRYPGDIDNVIKMLVENGKAESAVGMVELTNDHPSWTFKISDDGFIRSYVQEATSIQNFNRQLLDKAYLPYSIYAVRWEAFKKYKKFYLEKTLPYFLRREQKIEIDDEVDFYVAECLIKKYLSKE